MSKRTSVSPFYIVLVIVIALMTALAVLGPSSDKVPVPLQSLGVHSALAASQPIHMSNADKWYLSDSKDECDDSRDKCCEDDGAPDHEEPKCTATPVPQPSLVPSDTPAPTATAVNTPTPRSTPVVVPTRTLTRTPAPTNTPTQMPLPTMPATATPTKNPTSTPVNTPTRTPQPDKPTSTPQGKIITTPQAPAVVSPTARACQQTMVLTWDEETDGANWLIKRFKYLKVKGVCVQINFDPPADADWIDEVILSIDSLYK